MALYLFCDQREIKWYTILYALRTSLIENSTIIVVVIAVRRILLVCPRITWNFISLDNMLRLNVVLIFLSLCSHELKYLPKIYISSHRIHCSFCVFAMVGYLASSWSDKFFWSLSFWNNSMISLLVCTLFVPVVNYYQWCYRQNYHSVYYFHPNYIRLFHIKSKLTEIKWATKKNSKSPFFITQRRSKAFRMCSFFSIWLWLDIVFFFYKINGIWKLQSHISDAMELNP